MAIIYLKKHFWHQYKYKQENKNIQSWKEHLLPGDFPLQLFILFTTFKILTPHNEYIIEFQCFPLEEYTDFLTRLQNKQTTANKNKQKTLNKEI